MIAPPVEGAHILHTSGYPHTSPRKPVGCNPRGKPVQWKHMLDQGENNFVQNELMGQMAAVNCFSIQFWKYLEFCVPLL